MSNQITRSRCRQAALACVNPGDLQWAQGQRSLAAAATGGQRSIARETSTASGRQNSRSMTYVQISARLGLSVGRVHQLMTVALQCCHRGLRE